MNFIRKRTKDFYLLDSQIENIFINEYLPAAPGDFVKVYIYGYMYAESGMEMSNALMANQLGISGKTVNDAWNYWEKLGAIRKSYRDSDGGIDFTVEFISLKEQMYGKNEDIPDVQTDPEINLFGNETVKTTFEKIENMMARSLSSTEISEILSWIADDRIAPEVILFGVEYCLGKNKTSLRYMAKVIRNWSADGYNTVAAVQEHLEDVDQRFYQYKRILRALGFTRNATETEKKMMDNWFDEMGFSMDRILEACAKTAGIPSPNFNYVNKVLENWKSEADRRGRGINSQVVTQATLNRYYEYLRSKADREAEERLQEVYRSIPQIREIDEEIRRMGVDLTKTLLMGKDSEENREIRQKMDRMTEERAVLLTENNYEMDYTDVRYLCENCGDTGVTDLGERCRCVDQRIEEAAIWQKKESKV